MLDESVLYHLLTRIFMKVGYKDNWKPIANDICGSYQLCSFHFILGVMVDISTCGKQVDIYLQKKAH